MNRELKGRGIPSADNSRLSENRLDSGLSEIPANRISPLFGFQLSIWMAELVAHLPKAYGLVAQKMTDELELPRLRFQTFDERDVVKGAACDLAMIKKLTASLNNFLLDCLWANIEVRLGQGVKLTADEIRAQVYEEIKPQVPRIEPERLNALDYTVLEMDLPAMLEHLLKMFGGEICRLCQSFHAVLLELRGQQYLGTLEPSKKKRGVGKYDFYRPVGLHGKIGSEFSHHVRQGQTTVREAHGRAPDLRGSETVTVYENIRREEIEYSLGRRHAHHEHHYYCADFHTLPAADVEQPGFVRTLVNVVPAWLKPALRIVAGPMSKESIQERDLGEKRWKVIEETVVGRFETVVYQGFLASPAIVLDDVVLCGWSGRDLDNG